MILRRAGPRKESAVSKIRALHQELKLDYFRHISAYNKFEARNSKFETSTKFKFSNDKNKD